MSSQKWYSAPGWHQHRESIVASREHVGLRYELTRRNVLKHSKHRVSDLPGCYRGPESQGGIVILSDGSSRSFIADLKPLILSPIPLPSSGSFLGPNTSKAIPKITNRCVGCKSPSNITFLLILKVRKHRSRRISDSAPCSENSTFHGWSVSEELSRQDLHLFCRNGLDRIPIKPQMRINHLGRKPPDPVV